MSERSIVILRGIVIVIVLGLVFTCSLSVNTVDAEAGQVTFTPTDDTFVVSSIPDSNYGGQNYLQIMYFVNGTFPAQATCQTLVWLKFDLSTVPNGAAIDMATLQSCALFASEGFNVSAYSSSNDWTELSLTYSNTPNYNSTSMDSALVANEDEWCNWTVTDAVRNALNGNSTFVTIVLSDPLLHNSASVAVFSSKEAHRTDRAPKLSVHWSSAVPEFSTFPIVALFLIGTLLTATTYKKKIDRSLKRPRAVTKAGGGIVMTALFWAKFHLSG